MVLLGIRFIRWSLPQNGQKESIVSKLLTVSSDVAVTAGGAQFVQSAVESPRVGSRYCTRFFAGCTCHSDFAQVIVLALDTCSSTWILVVIVVVRGDVRIIKRRLLPVVLRTAPSQVIREHSASRRTGQS